MNVAASSRSSKQLGADDPQRISSIGGQCAHGRWPSGSGQLREGEVARRIFGCRLIDRRSDAKPWLRHTAMRAEPPMPADYNKGSAARDLSAPPLHPQTECPNPTQTHNRPP